MSCCVIGCHNRSSSKRKNWEQQEEEEKNCNKFSFHLFPKDTNKKNKWLEVLDMKNYNPSKTATVCSKHFKEEDYKPGSVKKKLKANAIPYLPMKEQSLPESLFTESLENIEFGEYNILFFCLHERNTLVFTDVILIPISA